MTPVMIRINDYHLINADEITEAYLLLDPDSDSEKMLYIELRDGGSERLHGRRAREVWECLESMGVKHE